MGTRKSSDEIDRLLEAVIDNLATDGINALSSVVAFTRLAAEHGYARQTVHTHLGSGPNAVASAATRLSSMEVSNVRQTMDQVMGMYRSAPMGDRSELFESLLAVNFSLQFTNRTMPVGWLLQAAAITRSESWAGDPKPPANRDLDRASAAILGARRQLYDVLGDELRGLLAMACRAVGRVPRPDTDIDEIVLLMSALHDGLVLRTILHPDRVTPELAGRALYRLAEALTVEGGIASDPMRPVDPRQAEAFDRLVAATIAAWAVCEAGEEPLPAEIAASAGYDAETVAMLFDDLEQLTESAARWLIPSGELVTSIGHPYPLEILSTALAALADAVDGHRSLFGALPRDRGVVHDFTAAVADALDFANRSGIVHCANIGTTASAVVRFALEGAAGLQAIEPLLSAIDGRPTPPT